MPETDKKKVEPKMVRESDLLAIKAERDKLKEKLANSTRENSQLKSELQIAKTNGDDEDEVIRIKEALVAQAEEIRKDREKLDQDLASLTGREKESRVQALASQYQIEVALLMEEEDPEKKAMALALERLTSEKETPSPESIVESSIAGGLIRKQIKDMTDTEFAEKEKQLKAEYLAKAAK